MYHYSIWMKQELVPVQHQYHFTAQHLCNYVPFVMTGMCLLFLGVSMFLKAKNPDVKVILADPQVRLICVVPDSAGVLM